MPMTAPTPLTDPLAVFISNALAMRAPSPLTDTRYDVAIEAGLAVVTTTRRFTNAEEQAIEATITFPIPVHAALFEMTARIGERRLVAKAQARRQARETYETALETGKAAVLHEELLKGVHMLSVGQIPPGAEVEVTAVWCLSMSAVDSEARLRIPLTAGDVYGRSPLADSDDLIHGGEVATGRLTVRSADGAVTVNGAPVEGETQIRLDRPIDLAMALDLDIALGLKPPRPLQGRAADGRAVALRIAPRDSEDQALDIAILLDHSGSMGSRVSVAGEFTAHQAALTGLSRVAEQLTAPDRVDLWEFDNTVMRVGAAKEGEAPAEALRRRMAELCPPRGGTEIGGALQAVFAGSPAADILLITDGKSHALDPQALAQSGRRVSVLLLGEDSLEARVGYLAALTGGELFIASVSDIGETLAAAVTSLRSPAAPRPAIEAAPEALTRVLGGMAITAEWRDDAKPDAMPAEGVVARAAGAFAAMLALPAMPEPAAAALAEAEGLVSHLTSLVLVDEAGATQEGLPAYRKVALPTPASASMDLLVGDVDGMMSMPAPAAKSSSRERLKQSFRAMSRVISTGQSGGAIDWESRPDLLRKGDLSALSDANAARVRQIAETPSVRALAETLKLDPVVLALALLARSLDGKAPGAGKFAKLLLGGADAKALDRLSRSLGL